MSIANILYEDEIRLFGQPINFIVPEINGNKEYDCLKFKNYTKNIPKLIAGKIYKAYFIGNSIDDISFSWYDIYIDINNILYGFRYSPFCYTNKYKIIQLVQEEVSFSLIRKMFLNLYKKIEDLEEQLSNKVNHSYDD